MKSTATVETGKALEVSYQKPLSDGRRLRISKEVSGQEMLSIDSPENAKNFTSELREEMARVLSEAVSKILPITHTNQLAIDGMDKYEFFADIYVFTPQELTEFKNNVIIEHERSKSQG